MGRQPVYLPRPDHSLGAGSRLVEDTLAGAYTVAVIISAVAAPYAGRLIDAGHGVRLLVFGTVAAGLLVGLLAVVEQAWQFYAVWAGIGVAAAACLYEPCSAFRSEEDNSELQ